MNVKKMFASLAGVLMLAQAAAPMVTGAATYSDELQGAYDYAYSKGITTMTSIDNANMYGELTRGQLSKMISQWAEKEMGVKADETASCSFSDASTAEGDLATWVVKACQMGLMGQGITAFRPNDKVTRGEFGTVLSRAIWGEKYNQENPFYAKHLQALKDAGIMTKIEEPNSLEIRGWVMLMLQRAAETVSGDDECNDPAVLLACALGSTGCPAKCAEAEKNNTDQNPNNAFNGVIAGDLSVAVSSSNSTVSIPNDGIVKVAELAIKASEDIQLQSIDVSRLWLSKNEGVKVWIEKDGRRITSSSSFFGDSKASLTFNNWGYVVKWDETLDLVVSLDSNKVDAWSEFQFKVSNVVSSAKNSTISPDTTGTFRTAVYTATSITIVSSTNTFNAASPRSYNMANDTTFSFGEFKVQNDSSASMEKDVLIKSITFKVEGSIENLSNFKLLRDSKEISSKYSIDGKSLTFVVNDQLDSGKSATYKVTAEPTNIESAAGDSYTLSIKKAEDVIAEEIGSNATAYRVSVKETVVAAAGWDVVSLGTTKISGGNITLTKDSSLASTVSADWGYSDVVIAKGTMKVNQAVKFDSMNIALNQVNSAALPATNWLNEIIRRAALVIDGKTYQAEISDKTATTQWLTIGSEIYLTKGTHDVELQISLVNSTATIGAAPGTAVTKVTFNSISATSVPSGNYTNGDETTFTPATQIAGTIRVSDINIAKKSVNVKKSWPSEDVKFAAGNSDEYVVLVGEITNNEDKTLEVNKFVVKPTSLGGVLTAASTTKLWDLSITMNDSTSSNVAIKANDTSVSIDSLTTTVEPGKSVKFELRIIPNADLAANDTFKFQVSVEGKLDGNDTKSSDLNSAKVTATAGATDTVVANTTDSKLIIKPGVSTKIASFNYNVKNDSKDLTDVVFDVKWFNANDLDDLTIDFGGSVGAPGLTYTYTASTAPAGTITAHFSNVVTLPVDNYKVSVYATFNESAIDTTTAGYFTNNGTVPTTAQPSKDITKVTMGTAATDKFATLTYSHYVAKAYPILSVKDKNTTSDNARLDIAVRKSNDDASTVKLINFTANPAFVNTAADTALTWRVIDWSDVNIKNVDLDATSAVVLRTAKTYVTTWNGASISDIEFLVTDDEGHTVKYSGVKAGSDFASLSL